MHHVLRSSANHVLFRSFLKHFERIVTHRTPPPPCFKDEGAKAFQEKKRRAGCLIISVSIFQDHFYLQVVSHHILSMNRHYSTLELVRHDETARAPERDYDATAFELDAGALAPQVYEV